MIRKFFYFVIIFFFALSFLAKSVTAQKPVRIYFFWGEGCPHCEKESIFLEKLADRYPEIAISDFEISKDRESIELFQKIAKELKANIAGFPTPFTVVSDQYVIGYLNDETTGKVIENAVLSAIKNGDIDLVGGLEDVDKPKVVTSQSSLALETINLPLLGEIRIKSLSLPILTVVIGLLDGFNPCAMWALLFLITLLLGMEDRKKMWILGSAFILTSGFVYFLLMSAWLNVFLLLGFIIWIRVIVGIVALGAGGYNIRDYIINKDGTCKVTSNKKRQGVFEKLKKITQKKQLVFALGGIILLALAVNLVELVCSAGLPAIYAQVLALSNLPTWQYYFYILLYVSFFILDDLVVFVIAMTSLKAVGISGKYSRFSHLFGGIIMVVIGILMLFKPEFLMFG